MNDDRWAEVNRLIAAMREAERLAGSVGRSYFHVRRHGPDAVSHPSEDEAKRIESDIKTLCKLAAGIAQREVES